MLYLVFTKHYIFSVFTKYDFNPFKLTCKRFAMYGGMIICNFPVFRPVISRNLSSFESGFLLRYSYYLRYAYLILQSTANHHNPWSETFEFTTFDSLLRERFEKGENWYSFLCSSCCINGCI